ncbi:hypothetical protein [Parabacteroides distasonis]|uniref:hypothetical protein n=1 Tax=Parabacteroides distasonis TaxID=823 RepID=UPI002164940A|nr:hypothetical protein [Parabacteroides distasonis]UVQ93568.1 hypothetical protein NXX59_05640 [Parabacteroides distasonis]UVR79408.1 hypothetical protein NXV66_05460 [Parabacteroides distasonis]
MNIRYPIYEGVYRILTFKPNGILFPEGFSAPVRNPARLAVKKYRKRSEDDYFTATSPQGRLAGFPGTRGYLCRKK